MQKLEKMALENFGIKPLRKLEEPLSRKKLSL